MTSIAITALVLRLVLAAMFAVAGVAKLLDRAGTRRAVADFGAPGRLAAPLALALPVAELAVAGLLVSAPTAAIGACGALALLAVFTGAIALSLARGKAPDCHCFGQLHSTPTSWRTLARNTGLLAIAGIALAGSLTEPRTSAVAWIADLQPVEAVAVALGAIAAALLVGGSLAFVTLLRSYGRVLVRLERVEAVLLERGDLPGDDGARDGLAPGTPAPWFLTTTAAGDGASRDDLLRPGLPVLLLFTSPHCGPCSALMPEAARWQREHADALTVAFASEGPAEAVGAEATEFELERVLVDESGGIAASFEVRGTPSAVLIDADGTVASWLASGRDEIEALVAEALSQDPEPGLPVGSEAPPLELPALDGSSVSLSELRGRDTLLLFWNPGCGYCRSMHDDLRAWETTANGVTPRLVVVSSGDEETTRADGFASTVLLDPEFAASSAFGAGGTPMAVLVDSQGKVASRVVGGSDAVLALAGLDVARSLLPSAGGRA